MIVEPPKPVRNLVIVTVAIALASGLFNIYIAGAFGSLGSQALLSLSWMYFYPWQLGTYLFVCNGSGISVGSLIELFFHMYLLWFMGGSVAAHFDSKRFFRLYFTSGLVAGIVALSLMILLFPQGRLAGQGPAIFGVMAVWASLNPYMEMLLFFSIRIQARWLALALLGIVALIDLSQGNFLHLAAYLSGSLSGYLYGIIAWNLQGPFQQIHSLDAFISNIGESFRNWRREQEKIKTVHLKHAKIFDIKSGKAVMDDETFMDAMLDKISTYGEDTLSRKEKKRMASISEKKRLEK